MDEREADADLNRAVLRDLWEHHWWGFEQFIDVVSGLEEEEFRRELGLSYGSVHGILAHTVGAEMVWLKRVLHDESMARVPGAEELPDLEAVEKAWEETRDGWRGILESDDLERVIHYRNTKGQAFSDPIWRVMAHLIDHSATYRGILISALRILGRTPPATGVITYTRIVSGKYSL
ncbi:MAG TPA: DinB family protein [Pyrinomonadaceae bacterium]|jgi:uncharacterized damage-inducible protein DinB